MHVVDVMNAANSVRCLLELSADELEETCDMCREHGDALLAGGDSIGAASPDLPIRVCIKLNILGKEAARLSVRHRPHLGSSAQKTEVFNIVQTPAGVGSSVRLAAAVSARESCG